MAQLPEPADVADCAQLGATGSAFLRAVAAVALAESQGSPAVELSERLASLGDGYGSRMSVLGCDAEALLIDVQLPRPGADASLHELVEFLLSGTDVAYPEEDRPPVLEHEAGP